MMQETKIGKKLQFYLCVKLWSKGQSFMKNFEFLQGMLKIHALHELAPHELYVAVFSI